MKKLIKLLMIPLMVFSLFSCGNGSGSNSLNDKDSMKELFRDDVEWSYAIGLWGHSDNLQEVTYSLEDIISPIEKIERKPYYNLLYLQPIKTIYVKKVTFNVVSDFEFYLDLNLCDSEANWVSDETTYHIVPGEDVAVSFTFDNFKVKRMKYLILSIGPEDENGKSANNIHDLSQLDIFTWAIYNLKVEVQVN